MPHYHKLGNIPHKRHTQFRKPDGTLYAEQLVSTEGFSDTYSLVYHNHAPTKVVKIDEPYEMAPKIAIAKNLQHRSFLGFNVKPEKDFLQSRKYVLVNDDVYISLAAPQESMTGYFFKNSGAHEMIFVHEGEGTLKTMYGNIDFKYGDHLIIPRGIIYQMIFNTPENRLFILESAHPFKFPKRYMNSAGQLLEHSPYCERDIRKPDILESHDTYGDFLVKIKRDDMIFPYHYATHPFDLVHQPPPVHQTFETPAFVVCAFVPRMYDYHPDSIPAPYNHSNVDSDEVLYYVDGEFMSRKHVERGMISLHPTGIPHGPHPGAVEKSIGQKSTSELAVMVDTFKPLKITEEALDIEDQAYYRSWVEGDTTYPLIY